MVQANPNPHNDDIVDIEEYSNNGRDPPRDARRFRIRIDKERKDVDVPEMTGREILALVNKAPPRFKLVQRLRGGKTKTIAPDEVVDFRAPGVERFSTMACDQTEGDGAEKPKPRREVELPADDVEFLDGLERKWETIVVGKARWLIIYDHPLPPGYTEKVVDVALQLPGGFPDTQIDMAYFAPAVVRTDGKAIGSTSGQDIGGRGFQRWSRHRTAENPWRIGVDGVATHMALVDEWLARELRK